MSVSDFGESAIEFHLRIRPYTLSKPDSLLLLSIKSLSLELAAHLPSVSLAIPLTVSPRLSTNLSNLPVVVIACLCSSVCACFPVEDSATVPQ